MQASDSSIEVAGCRYSYDNVKRWNGGGRREIPINIFLFSRLIVPVNITRLHWFLAVIYPATFEIEIVDSVGPGEDYVFQVLARYMQDEDQAKWSGKAQGPWKRRVGLSPMQLNSFDCGVNVLRYAERVIRGEPLHFTQDGNAAFRFFALARVINGLLMNSAELVMSSGVAAAPALSRAENTVRLCIMLTWHQVLFSYFIFCISPTVCSLVDRSAWRQGYGRRGAGMKPLARGMESLWLVIFVIYVVVMSPLHVAQTASPGMALDLLAMAAATSTGGADGRLDFLNESRSVAARITHPTSAPVTLLHAPLPIASLTATRQSGDAGATGTRRLRSSIAAPQVEECATELPGELLAQALAADGLRKIIIAGDGNCLFGAFSFFQHGHPFKQARYRELLARILRRPGFAHPTLEASMHEEGYQTVEDYASHVLKANPKGKYWGTCLDASLLCEELGWGFAVYNTVAEPPHASIDYVQRPPDGVEGFAKVIYLLHFPTHWDLLEKI